MSGRTLLRVRSTRPPSDTLVGGRPFYARPADGAADEGPALLTLLDPAFVDAFFQGVGASKAGWKPQAWKPLRAWRDWSEPPRAMHTAAGAPLFPPTVVHREPLDGEADEAVPEAGWLRKLYRASHQHFHVVGCDWTCDRFGRPPLDPSRVVETGLVVRRLVRDPHRERWADWLPSPRGGGMWLEVADEAMRPMAGGPPLDPAAVPPAALGGRETWVRSRLDLPTSAPIVLEPQPMTLLPKTLAAGHTSAWAYLSLATGVNEVPEPEVSSAEALAEQAQAWLHEALADTDAIGQRVRAAFGPLRDALLPPRPGQDALQAAVAELREQWPDTYGAWLSEHRRTVVEQTWSLGESLDAAGTWWDEVIKASVTDPDGRHYARIVLLDAVHALLDPTDERLGLRHDADMERTVLAALCRRVRRHRIHLAKTFYDRISPEAKARGFEQLGPGALSGELTALLAAEDRRDEAPLPWSPLASFSRSRTVHQASAFLEEVLADVDQVGRGAGGGYGAALQALREQVAGDLKDLDGELYLQEQPVSGLLVHPGLRLSRARVSRLASDARQHFLDGGSAVEAEAHAQATATIPRFDAGSLYAVWCYARVGGRDDCEAERVVWSPRSEVFSLAPLHDLLGMKPARIELPDLPRLLRDLPRVARAGARPYAAVSTPADSGLAVGSRPEDTARQWGIAWICSLGIPVFTIVAWISFSMLYAVLVTLPGFVWILLLRICIPAPAPKES